MACLYDGLDCLWRKQYSTAFNVYLHVAFEVGCQMLRPTGRQFHVFLTFVLITCQACCGLIFTHMSKKATLSRLVASVAWSKLKVFVHRAVQTLHGLWLH
eukprot:gnl/MRDRNA2_/MRDRNA2_79629_c0_seq1.p1 gnl/MRDRNA2_/MRDRNA2_79629_c0~~gnl/MRDRNA2_/MRDRNA2_79629_c0_seq1.p1  ORF type:complete len:100 (-),score=9.42 gnl/MRDRNA2_/MRDRNA2_79629_c0_seq1:39-338(-)